MAVADAGTKRFGMFLKGVLYPDLHEDWLFPLGSDYLVGMGSSRWFVLDTSLDGTVAYPGLDWAREPDLSFDSFRRGGLIRVWQRFATNWATDPRPRSVTGLRMSSPST